MAEKRFQLQRQVLQFIKKLRKVGLQALPPAFFLLVNTVAACLLKVSEEAPHKIRKFVGYWLERIELETAVEEEFDYPKYLLRNNLCSLLIEEADYRECLKLCNFNIKEISSDVLLAQQIRRSASDAAPKAKLLVLAMLFRMDCLLMLPEPVDRGLLRDLQSKCLQVFESHNLSTDRHLKKTVQSKLETVAQKLRPPGPPLETKSRFQPPAQSSSNSPHPRQSPGEKEKHRSSSKGFIIKKSFAKPGFRRAKDSGEDSLEQSRERQQLKLQQSLDFRKAVGKRDASPLQAKKSANNFFILGRKKSVADLSRDCSERQLERSFAHEASKPRLVSFGKKEAKKLSPTPKLSPQLASVKKEAMRDYSDGLLGFLKLGRSLKDQVRTLEVEYKRDHKLTVLRPSSLFDEAPADQEGSELDLQIKNNFESLLTAQQEWERRTSQIQERLERLERCGVEKERQTNAEETHSALPSVTSKRCSNGSSAPDADGCNTSDSKSPFNHALGSRGHRPPPSRLKPKSRTPSNQNLKVDLAKTAHSTPLQARLASSKKLLKTPSADLRSTNTQPSSCSSRSLDAFMTAFKLAVNLFEQGLDRFEAVRQVTQGLDGSLYELTFARWPGEEAQVTIDVARLEEDPQSRTACLTRKSLDMEQLRFLFLQIHLAEALPCHLPAAAFTSLEHFLSLLLAKFIRVDSVASQLLPAAEVQTRLTILKTPKSIVRCDKPVLLCGAEFEASLVHLHGCTFRLLLRPLRPDEEPEAVQVEVVFNDWVLNQFFQQFSGREYPNSLDKLVRGERLSEEESRSFEASYRFNRDAIWLIDTAEKKVLDSQAEQALAGAAAPREGLRRLPRLRRHEARKSPHEQQLLPHQARRLEARPVHRLRGQRRAQLRRSRLHDPREEQLQELFELYEQMTQTPRA